MPRLRRIRGSPVEPLKQQIAARLLEWAAPMENSGAAQIRIAELLQLTPQRWSALRHGRLDLFSLDGLVILAARAGLVVRLRATRPYARG